MVAQILSILKKNCIYYALAGVAVLALHFFLRSGDSSHLAWILAPTARWAGILGGLAFEPLPGKGYVCEAYRFLIAPPCSGLRFLQIVLLMLVASHTHRIAAGRRKTLWLPFCFIFSYLFTISVNGLRIVLSVYFPVLLSRAPLSVRFLPPETLHTLTGVSVYFSALLILYPAISSLISRLFEKTVPAGHSTLKPALWYLSAVLFLPLIRKILTGEIAGFGAYAIPVALACGVILLLSRVVLHILK